jgi:hypothetical protein
MNMLFHKLKVHSAQGSIESAPFGTGDIERFEKVMPDFAFWKKAGHNLVTIDLEQAAAMYRVLIAYYAQNEISDEEYPADPLCRVPVASNLRSVFDDLIEFCEGKLGLKDDGQERRRVGEKQEESRRAKEKRAAEELSAARKLFASLPALKLPSAPEIRSKLEGKRADYERRMANVMYPRQIALMVSHSYRASDYKIALIDRLLSGEEVGMVSFLESMYAEHGDSLVVRDLYENCAIISVYIGAPLIQDLTEADLIKA